MMRATFVIGAVALLCGTAAAEPLSVTVVSPCECRGNDSKERPSTPPKDAHAIQAVSVSDVGWPGIGVQLNWQPERIGIENKWYTLIGLGYTRSFASHAPGRERRLEVRGFEPLAFSLRTRRSTN
jgi:hypothetical protein